MEIKLYSLYCEEWVGVEVTDAAVIRYLEGLLIEEDRKAVKACGEDPEEFEGCKESFRKVWEEEA